MRKEAIDMFFRNMIFLVDGKKLDLYESSIDGTFERICGALFKKKRGDEIWYDGTSDLAIESNDNNEIIFTGNMHVMEGQFKHWRESFRAKVYLTENTFDCLVEVECGKYIESGNLYGMFGYKEFKSV